MIRAAILSLVLSIAGVASVSAEECGKLCSLDWWVGDPTQEEVAAEIATADVNARDEYGVSPLFYAAVFGTFDSITALIDAGADVNARNNYDRTPLHEALRGGTTANVITAFLDAGADGRAKDTYGNTPFDYAKGNEELKGTDAYSRLNDAQYD